MAALYRAFSFLHNMLHFQNFTFLLVCVIKLEFGVIDVFFREFFIQRTYFRTPDLVRDASGCSLGSLSSADEGPMMCAK
jgi:hypothetical protein